MAGSLTIVVTEPIEYTPAGVWELIVNSLTNGERSLPISEYRVDTIFTTSSGLHINFQSWGWGGGSGVETQPMWRVYDDFSYEEYRVDSCVGDKTGQFESTWVVSVPEEIESMFNDIVRVSYRISPGSAAWWESQVPNWLELESFTVTTSNGNPLNQLRTKGAVTKAYGVRAGIPPDYGWGYERYPTAMVEYQATIYTALINDIQMRVIGPSGALIFDTTELSWQQDPDRSNAVFADIGPPTPDIFWTQRVLCQEMQS